MLLFSNIDQATTISHYSIMKTDGYVKQLQVIFEYKITLSSSCHDLEKFDYVLYWLLSGILYSNYFNRSVVFT